MPPKPKGMSVRDYARHRKGLGLRPWSKSAIQRALALGYIHRLASGGIDAEIADEEWALAVNPAKRHQYEQPKESAELPGLEGPDEPPGHLKYADIRAKREWYQCQNARLDWLERKGQLVTRESVEASTFDVLRGIRNRFQQIPSRVDSLLAAESDPRLVAATLRSEIDAILLDLSGKLEKRAAQDDAVDEEDEGPPEPKKKRPRKKKEASP